MYTAVWARAYSIKDIRVGSYIIIIVIKISKKIIIKITRRIGHIIIFLN